jgi:peptidoglycan/LPS O-acetylase OafA/YrhL
VSTRVFETEHLTPEATTAHGQGYRPDIDGLRAVAVLMVLAFHLGVTHLRGGFVGVDVFFVISGYLISATILNDLERSRFSIARFYERRIRRIFPALFFMLIVTSIFACIYLLPTELEHFAASLVAATGSASNIYFWNQSGYFDAPATTKALLHTWSLAVEEQFYIVFPVLLVVIRRLLKERLRLSIVVLAVVSFVISAFGAYKFPSATFYMPYTRAWELLLGTILALKLLPRLRGTVARNIASISGLCLILFAGLKYSSTTHFPGIAALAPCLGAVLIIAAGESGSSVVGQALSLRPMVFVGLISYSLYLWHWPIIVFQRVGSVLMKGASDSMLKVVTLGASLVIATLSWKFVELPFRHGKLKLAGPMLFKLAAVAAVVPLSLGAAMLAFHGLPSRFPSESVRVASYLDYRADNAYRSGTCFISSSYHFDNFDRADCLRQDSTKPNDLLIGDSHAAMLWYGLSTTFTDVNLMQATSSGCKPTLKPSRADTARCRNLMNYVFKEYLPTHHVDTLLIAGRWTDKDLPRLTRTIAWAKNRGLKVVVFGPIVQYDAALPRLLATSIKQNNPALPNLHHVKSYERLDGKMEAMARDRWKVPYISFFKLLCSSGSCIEYAGNGVPLQADYDHLTQDGSLFMAQKLRDSGGLP